MDPEEAGLGVEALYEKILRQRKMLSALEKAQIKLRGELSRANERMGSMKQELGVLYAEKGAWAVRERPWVRFADLPKGTEQIDA